MSENTHYLRKVRPSPKYDVIFSVVNPQPEDIDFQWDNELYIESGYFKNHLPLFFVKNAIITFHFSGYFRPFLQKLHLLSDFRVKSQWLYLLDWHQIPKKGKDRFELNHLQIPHIITPLEKKIGECISIIFVSFLLKHVNNLENYRFRSCSKSVHQLCIICYQMRVRPNRVHQRKGKNIECDFVSTLGRSSAGKS